MRRLAFLLLGALAVGSVGCGPVKRMLRGKQVTLKPDATAVVSEKRSDRTYTVALTVKTEPEADVRAELSTRQLDKVARGKASKSGEAQLELEWSPALDGKSVSVIVSKQEPTKLGVFGGDEKHGTATVALTEPWGFRILSGELTCHGDGPPCLVKQEGLGLRLSAPKGTKAVWAGRALSVTGEVVPLPAADVEKLALHAFDAPPFKLETPLALTFPSGKTGSVGFTFGADAVRALYVGKLGEVKKGPVVLPGDDAAPPKARALHAIHCKKTLYGKPARLSDYDLVAFCEDKTRSRSCGGYHSASGKSASFELRMYDEAITVYDRRTGKVKASRTFPAPSVGCPSSFMGKGSGSDASFPNREQMDAWLKTFVQAP